MDIVRTFDAQYIKEIMAKKTASERIFVRCNQDFKKDVEAFSDDLGETVSSLVRMAITEKMRKSKWQNKKQEA